jgi:hypothetical protein
MPAAAPITAFLAALILVPALSIYASAQQPKQQPVHDKPLFSEDFESGALDPSIWTQQVTGDAILKVQSDKVAHGKYALLVRSPTPAQRTMAFILAHNLPAALSHHHFGRAYMYITAVPDRHIIFLTAGTVGFPKYRYQEVASAHGIFQLTYVDTTNQGPLGEDYHAFGTVPLNRWFLLEWEFNDQPDEAAIWIDGQKEFATPFTFKTAGQSSGLVGGFTDLAIGFRLWGAAPVPFDIYYDDIALDTHRIGPVESASPTRHLHRQLR